MASKGLKTGTSKVAAPKPAAKPEKLAVPKVPFAAAEAEKTAPAAEAMPALVASAIEAAAAKLPEPAPVLETVPQEVTEAVNTVEAAVEPIVEANATEAVNIAESAGEAAAQAQYKETTMIEANTIKAQALFTDMNDRTKTVVEKSTKMVEEANEFAKGNIEALVESSKIAAKGFESLGQDAADYGRKSFESATSAFKTFAAVKSPTELFKLQSDFVRSAFDAYVAEASKNTEAMLKLAGDAAQPLSNRLALAAEKVKTAA